MSITSELFYTTSNEQLMALLLDVLNAHYPNVEFCGLNNGTGRYGLTVVSRYTPEKPIHPYTLNQMNSFAYQAAEIIAVAVKRLEDDGLLEHYE